MLSRKSRTKKNLEITSEINMGILKIKNTYELFF